jgi:hypothetical protein
MGHSAEAGKERRLADRTDGVVTLALLVLAFLAFDDITTDNATSFTLEYAFLTACAVWGFILIARLALRSRFITAAVCASLLMAILWGQRGIGPGTRASWQPEYVVASVAFVGFLVVSTYLLLTPGSTAQGHARS